MCTGSDDASHLLLLHVSCFRSIYQTNALFQKNNAHYLDFFIRPFSSKICLKLS